MKTFFVAGGTWLLAWAVVEFLGVAFEGWHWYSLMVGILEVVVGVPTFILGASMKAER